jgi:hypothetical protein
MYKNILVLEQNKQVTEQKNLIRDQKQSSITIN